MSMQVANLSSITWNRLHVNSARLDEDITPNTLVETQLSLLPKGVDHRILTSGAAKEWLLKNAPKEKEENLIAGKKPIYHPQEFGTGLGAEYDTFVQNSVAGVEFLEVEPDTKLEEPVRWRIEYPDNSQSIHAQLIHVSRNSSLALLMSFHSDANAKGSALISTKIVLDEGASLYLVKAQMLGDKYLFMDDTGSALLSDASMELVQDELGGAKVYVGMQPELMGKGASFQAKVGYLGKKDRLVDVNYNVVHRGAKTMSHMQFEGVLDDRSQKTFRGTIDFRGGSKGSAGDEQENVLLLSDDIVNKTLPVILCEEEDVEGRHGATIGQLSEDMLFYLASRGISRKEAEQIMVRARLGTISRAVPEEALREELFNAVEEAFLS